MKAVKTIALLVLIAVAFGAGYLARRGQDAAATRRGATGRTILYYVDPMHPAYKSDKPGIAPDCGMTLEPVYADEVMGSAAVAPRKVLYYRDPEDPKYTATKPGLNPETGNTLEPVYADPIPASPVASAIRIPPERQQLIGVKFATVTAEQGGRTIPAVGKVAFDETRVQHVHPRIEGWVEQVLVGFTGDFVRKGDPMLTIYSPEMLATQQELLLARRARDVMTGNPLASAAEHGQSLFDATRRRLELWDLSADQIERVLETGQPIRSVALLAPATGFVLEKNVFANQRVSPGSDLYTIADLSRVWIMADVYESDIGAMRVGQQARIVLPYGDRNTTIAARVNYIQPGVDPATRTLKLRLEAANPGLRLRPEMFVDVEFTVRGEHRLTVPADAVLDTGDRQTVFVDLGDGYLQPRQVVAHERIGDHIVIASGLSEGERVVASGTFLVDSESQLKAALGGMGAPPPQSGATPPESPATGASKAAPSSPQPARPRAAGGHPHD
jgi:RND family efflux transporter MFP subunit